MCEVATGSAMADGSPSVLVSVGIAPRFSSMQRGRIRLSGSNTAARFPQVELAARQWQIMGGGAPRRSVTKTHRVSGSRWPCSTAWQFVGGRRRRPCQAAKPAATWSRPDPEYTDLVPQV